MNRRQWIGAGIAAALVAAGAGGAYEFQPDSDRALLSAIAPVMLAGALPQTSEAMDALLAGFDTAVRGLTPSVQHDVAQLLTLLRMPPTRIVLAGMLRPWHRATHGEIEHFLNRWRYSRFATLRAAYDALHQLCCAAWYGNARSWPAIGYPGPPKVA